MQKRLINIRDSLHCLSFVFALVIIWQMVCSFNIVPDFMLPSPIDTVRTFIDQRHILWQNMSITMMEAFYGLILSVVFSFIIAIFMDDINFLYRAIYPVLVITQTIPTIAIAPLLVLWFGYGTFPKILLVFTTCFFPLTINILTGLKKADANVLRLYHSMSATKVRILVEVKVPYSLDNFFSGLKLAASYAVVGAVTAEWLGGDGGLGVYMTRVRKAYAFDKMFTVIFLISGLSLIFMWIIDAIHIKLTPWKRFENKGS